MDWTTIVVAIIVNLPFYFVIWKQGRDTHSLFNSRMTELLKLTRKAAFEAGKKEGNAKPLR